MKILIAIPVYNEEAILAENVTKLYDFLKKNIADDWQIIIADNNSTDRTSDIGKDLEKNIGEIKYLHIPQKGKGRAIRAAWESNDAEVYVFMDADLATDLSALPALVAAVGRENYDLAAGARFHKDSKVNRSTLRKLISRIYRFILRMILGLKTKDAPCGFKAVNRAIVQNIIPQIKNNEWFFDTELVILAEKNNYRIKEIPVIWTEHKKIGRKSRVSFIKVSLGYLKEIWRLKKSHARN
ncbi:glycosyltransferase [Candidatus Falkowbacteria bacterium]|nr:glycosyltransferase [Candidatus Falkowbacteria bacterium]